MRIAIDARFASGQRTGVGKYSACFVGVLAEIKGKKI